MQLWVLRNVAFTRSDSTRIGQAHAREPSEHRLTLAKGVRGPGTSYVIVNLTVHALGPFL